MRVLPHHLLFLESQIAGDMSGVQAYHAARAADAVRELQSFLHVRQVLDSVIASVEAHAQRERARRISAEHFQIERSAFHSYGLDAHSCRVLCAASTGRGRGV